MDNPSVNKVDNLNAGLIKRAALYIGILAFALIVLLFMSAGQASATDVSGDITVDTTWHSGEVWNLNGTVTVLDGVTLEIEDGVTVVAENYCALIVEGTLYVNGTVSDPVIFTYNQSTPSYGSWDGIIFVDGSSGSIRFANIDSTYYGIYSYNESISINNVYVETSRYGVFLSSSEGYDMTWTLSDVYLTDISWDAIYVYNGNGSVDLTLDRVMVEDCNYFAYVRAYDYLNTGTVTLRISDSWFNYSGYGFQIEADSVDLVDVSDTMFSNSYDEYVLSIGYWSSLTGDMMINLDNVTLENVYHGIFASTADNISADFNMFYANNTEYSSDLYADGTLDWVVDNSIISNVDDALYTSGEQDGLSLEIKNSQFYNVGDAVDFEISDGDGILIIENVTIDYCNSGIYVENDNGSLDVTIDGLSVNASYYYAIYLTAYDYLGTGVLDLTVTNAQFTNHSDDYCIYLSADTISIVQITDTVFSDIDGYAIYLDSYDDDLSFILNNVTMEAVGSGFDAVVYNGNVVATLTDVHMDNIWWIGGWFVYAGDLDYSVIDSTFNNSDYGFWSTASGNVDVSVTNTEFTYVDYYALYMNNVPVGDLNAELNDVVMENVYGLIYTDIIGNITLSMDSVITNDTHIVAYLSAGNSTIAGIADISIIDSAFTNTSDGIIIDAGIINTVQVINTQVSGNLTPLTLASSIGFEFIGSESTDVTEIVFEDITVEDIGTVFHVEVIGDLDLVIESVVTNNTGIIGDFSAMNPNGTATMSVYMANCAFSNSSMGLVFETNILELDFTMFGTNTFTNISGQAIMMIADFGDVVLNLDNFVMENGGGISVYLGFGNIEVNVIDSVLDGSGSGILLDLLVNSNSLTNGFITLNVVNSTLSDAEYGICTWSEELVLEAMTGSTFVNITEMALWFDVRSATSTSDVLALTMSDIDMIDVGGGLLAYLNDGSMDLTITDVHIIATYLGVQVEVSSVLPTDLSTIDMVVTDSIFEDGVYGLYGISVNGGTAVISGCQFLGHSGVGYWFDSLYGNLTVDITDNVFDGGQASDMTIYVVEEVESEFELIGRTGDWDGTWVNGAGIETIDLPFEFTFDGVVYDSVVFSADGYLRFGTDGYILPVGYTDLYYNYEQFYGYKIADDNQSVLFQWYAEENTYWSSYSDAFQVVLYADGTIQFNYAYMDAIDTSVSYGIETYEYDYDLMDLNGLEKWEVDFMSYLFTPIPISYGVGAIVSVDEGNISAVITDNTVSGYYNGGIAVLVLDGNIDLEVTGNSFSKIYGDNFASLHMYQYGGTSDVNMAENDFERIWGLAIYLNLVSNEGGVKTVDMSDSTFYKVAKVLYSEIDIVDNTGRTGNDTLDITVNFLRNVLIDSYGMVCWIDLYLYDPVDWTVNVVQNMNDNVMTQEQYEGSWVFDSVGWVSYALGTEVYIDAPNDDENSVTLTQTSTATNNYLECPDDIWYANGIGVFNYLENVYGDNTKAVNIDISDNLINCTGYEGIYVDSYTYPCSGIIVDDVTIAIEDNEINDGTQYIEGIGVYVCVDTYSGVNYDRATDAEITHTISITGNLIEGVSYGIYNEEWYYQDNSIGTWNIDLVCHVDDNQILNSTWGITSELYGGSEFQNNYWPLNDEVAVANFVMNYVFTVDDNVMTSAASMYYWGEFVYVNVEYWAWVYPGALFADATADVTGTLSVSRNQISMIDTEMNGIYVYQWTGARSTGIIDAEIDVAIEDNVIEQTWTTDSHGPGPGCALWVENYVESGTYVYSYDDAAMVTLDTIWSITGNVISGEFREAIVTIDYIDVYYGMSSLTYNANWDISENTATDLRESGIDYQLYRDENTDGIIELNIDVSVQNNVVAIVGSDEGYGIRVDSTRNLGDWVYQSSTYGKNFVFSATVIGNTISGAGYGMEMYGAIYEGDIYGEEPFEDGTTWTYDNTFLVENNYINNSWEGMYLEGDMTVINNIIEDCLQGIYWYDAQGELAGNSITAEWGIDVEYPYVLVIQENTVDFSEYGIYVYYYGYWEYTDVQILDNVLTALDNTFLPWYWGFGLELYDMCNVLVDGNVITGCYEGIYVYYSWNITISDNQISDTDYGIDVEESEDVIIEANTVSDSFMGIYLDECWGITISDNTLVENYYGIYLDEDIFQTALYNNVLIDNWYYGLYDEYYHNYMEVIWYVDDVCQVIRNDVDFYGPLYVLDGGTMTIESAWMYIEGTATVEEGGVLSLSDVYVDECDFIDVYGTIWATLTEFEGSAVYLEPTATAEIRSSVFDYTYLIIDGCDAVIADNLFDDEDYDTYYGIVVRNGASPTIVSNLITYYEVGISAADMDMAGIYDNLIINNGRGIVADNCTGNIHDNIFLGNGVEILVRNCDVSIEDNEIGYTDLYQLLASYSFILSAGSSLEEALDPVSSLEEVLSDSIFDPYSVASWVSSFHYGIWAENSTVEVSNNQYGQLSYALYAVGSEVYFNDDVRTNDLVIPWLAMTSDLEILEYNMTLSVYTLNGIYAAQSDVYVSDCTIEVVDDALMFEASYAEVEGVTLMAGDFDYFLFGGSEVYNVNTTYETAKVEDSHSLNEGTWLTLTAMDKGDPAANVTIIIKNAKGEIVFEGVTDADGKVCVLLAQYSTTFEGKDDGFNPYTITALFASGNATMDLTMTDSYQDVTITGEGELDVGAILMVAGVLVIILLIVAAFMVMRRKK